MKKVYFKIIIPNYNNGEWIGKCLNSVISQKFKDYAIIVVDDCSTDNSVEVIKKYDVKLIQAKEKAFNGGARNIGIKDDTESEYTLFIDSDDWLEDENCLQTIYDIIQENNNPDCVSLSYNCVIGDNKAYQDMTRNTPKELVDSLYVACWTKCIKSNLIQLFPENTLMEDVVQHIKQCDKIETVVSCKKPIINWNRNNTNSCSRVENQNCQKGKWQSSMYRYAADLMDLECEHDYCEEHRKWRQEVVINNIREGKYIQ